MGAAAFIDAKMADADLRSSTESIRPIPSGRRRELDPFVACVSDIRTFPASSGDEFTQGQERARDTSNARPPSFLARCFFGSLT